MRKEDRKKIAEGYTKHVCLDAQGKVKRLPQKLRLIFQDKKEEE
jgi:acyl-CoA thioesterase FadM